MTGEHPTEMTAFRINVAGWLCQFLGTLFLWLDSVRVSVRLPREGIRLGDPPLIDRWYYHWASPAGFFLLLVGFGLCGIALWISRPRSAPPAPGVPTKDDAGRRRTPARLFYFLSPTLFFADGRKRRAGPEKAAVARCVKNLNIGFLTVTAVAAGTLLIADATEALPERPVIRLAILAVGGLYALSRCNEIFIAFIRDATSHLRPRESLTGLKYYERVGLAMRSYVELILAYALIYRAVSETVGGFSPPLDMLSSIYFSGVTIATIGYGDIHPTHWLPRVLTIYEVFNGARSEAHRLQNRVLCVICGEDRD